MIVVDRSLEGSDWLIFAFDIYGLLDNWLVEHADGVGSLRRFREPDGRRQRVWGIRDLDGLGAGEDGALAEVVATIDQRMDEGGVPNARVSNKVGSVVTAGAICGGYATVGSLSAVVDLQISRRRIATSTSGSIGSGNAILQSSAMLGTRPRRITAVKAETTTIIGYATGQTRSSGGIGRCSCGLCVRRPTVQSSSTTCTSRIEWAMAVHSSVSTVAVAVTIAHANTSIEAFVSRGHVDLRQPVASSQPVVQWAESHCEKCLVVEVVCCCRCRCGVSGNHVCIQTGPARELFGSAATATSKRPPGRCCLPK